MKTAPAIVIAVPKGRIGRDLAPYFKACGIIPHDDFYDEDSRALSFSTNLPDVGLIRVRAFDVATFVAFGAAHLGVVGRDVIDEFDYDDLYAPVDLKIGHCRLSVARHRADKPLAQSSHSHIRVATKYPNLTRAHFAKHGIQAECIKLNGAMELAPVMGLAPRIVDLVSTGSTLKANDLVEEETILPVSAYLVANRPAVKTRGNQIGDWIDLFANAAEKQS